jgi:hypothetical protein
MIDPLHGHTQSLLDRSSLEPAGELGRSRSTSRRDLWGSLGRGGLRSGISQETSQHPTRKMLDMTAARTRFANWRANMVDGSIRNSSMNHFALRGVQDLNCRSMRNLTRESPDHSRCKFLARRRIRIEANGDWDMAYSDGVSQLIGRDWRTVSVKSFSRRARMFSIPATEMCPAFAHETKWWSR